MGFVKTFLYSFKDDIVRRVFINNTFDGVITVLGIILAFFFAGINQPSIIIVSCLGSGIAMGVSGIFSSYLIETSERNLKIKNLEKQLLKSLKSTKISKKSKRLAVIVALFDGLSPIIATIILLIPFFLNGLIGVESAYLFTFSESIILMILLGALIGKFGRTDIIRNVFKTLGAGVTLTIILYLIELLKVY
jgi:predicted membrane protein (TIGR00267 family)